MTYVQPNVALVFDNSLTGYVSPFYGHRYRIEVAPSIGSWTFTQITADYRRYDRLPGPFVFASRFLYYGRVGRDASEFRIFAGSNDLIRGNTSGSYRRNECRNAAQDNTETGCAELDRLVGTQLAVGSFELRMPLFNPSTNGPVILPPMEIAAFYDMGLIWDDRSTIRWNRTRERRPDRRAGPAQDHRRLAARQPVRVRHRPAGLRHPVGPPCGHRALDLQPRYGLLERRHGGGGDAGSRRP